ncbi:hypothetical protein HPP92_028974 [Vanilla planifolia]|uniref:Uncharacterized protein n=1 Tax=Vanilla planifolia TaxID=51239 RepID=A0A835P3F8_VANPL|nr:hypothetical protein HPP92_028974 [Vanilla planifolia]KAG0446174.1 hypothetical protein HPP92_028963 [Vanilla planifolia]
MGHQRRKIESNSNTVDEGSMEGFHGQLRFELVPSGGFTWLSLWFQAVSSRGLLQGVKWSPDWLFVLLAPVATRRDGMIALGHPFLYLPVKDHSHSWRHHFLWTQAVTHWYVSLGGLQQVSTSLSERPLQDSCLEDHFAKLPSLDEKRILPLLENTATVFLEDFRAAQLLPCNLG